MLCSYTLELVVSNNIVKSKRCAFKACHVFFFFLISESNGRETPSLNNTYAVKPQSCFPPSRSMALAE